MNALQTIPTMESVYRATVNDLLSALRHVEAANDPATAAAAAQHCLNVGYHILDRKDLVRAITARLPAPTKEQLDAASMRRDKCTNRLFFTRPIGAFGDRVLMIQAQNNPDKPLLQVKIVTIPADTHIEPPLWDVTRPAERRVWNEPQTGSSAAGVV
ncbi:MAG: hypothetical protein O0V67_01635 [Methanocorpusculum sp.]|nr:hypothetical protein [Methanocorpusculum sp.]